MEGALQRLSLAMTEPRRFELKMGNPLESEHAPKPPGYTPPADGAKRRVTSDEKPCPEESRHKVARIGKDTLLAPRCSIFVNHEVCLRPLVAALRCEVPGSNWKSEDDLVSEMLTEDLGPTFEWLEANMEMSIAIANHETIKDKYLDVMGTLQGCPKLNHNEWAALYKWEIDKMWNCMNVSARIAKEAVASCGGRGRTKPIELRGSATPMKMVDLPGIAETYVFDSPRDGRRVLISGFPFAPHEMPLGRSVPEHIQNSVQQHNNIYQLEEDDHMQILPPSFCLRMIPVMCTGDSKTATATMGLDKLLNAQTEDGNMYVKSVCGSFATAIDEEGIQAAAQAYAVVATRSFMQPQNAKGPVELYNERGNQYILLTIYKDGKIEWQIGMNDSCHVCGG